MGKSAAKRDAVERRTLINGRPPTQRELDVEERQLLRQQAARVAKRAKWVSPQRRAERAEAERRANMPQPNFEANDVEKGAEVKSTDAMAFAAARAFLSKLHRHLEKKGYEGRKAYSVILCVFKMCASGQITSATLLEWLQKLLKDFPAARKAVKPALEAVHRRINTASPAASMDLLVQAAARRSNSASLASSMDIDSSGPPTLAPPPSPNHGAQRIVPLAVAPPSLPAVQISTQASDAHVGMMTRARAKAADVNSPVCPPQSPSPLHPQPPSPLHAQPLDLVAGLAAASPREHEFGNALYNAGADQHSTEARLAIATLCGLMPSDTHYRY